MKTRLAGAVLAVAFALPASAQPAQGADFEKYREGMWTRMQKMQEQMDKIRSTADAKEREKLMREHFESMREGMGMMSGYGPMMGGRGMMGSGPGAKGPGQGMGPGGGRGPGGGAMGRGFGRGPYAASECGNQQEPAARRDCMTNERLDVMQVMMEQMMEREGMRYGPKRR